MSYPIDSLDWALFSVVILFQHWFPLLEKIENWAFILPHNFPTVWVIFAGRGITPLHSAGQSGEPPFPRGGTTIPYLKVSKQAIKTFENKKHQKHELMLCALLTRAILTRNYFCREVFPKLCEFCFVPLKLKFFWSSEDKKKEKNIQRRNFFGG